MTPLQYEISGPIFKPKNRYLFRCDWHGNPTAALSGSPWGYGETCWYVRAESSNYCKYIAAETAELATAAAEVWVAREHLMSQERTQ